MLSSKKSRLLVLLLVASAAIAISYWLVVNGDRFASQGASVHELRVNSGSYIGKKITIKGYLSTQFRGDRGHLFLYATSDDALMRNHMAGILIDLYENRHVVELSPCMEQFVELLGVFREVPDPEIDTLGIAEVSYIYVLPVAEKVEETIFCIQ